jgi:hypothetical protein
MIHVRGVKLPDLRPFALIGVRDELHRLRDEIARLECIELTLAGALPEAASGDGTGPSGDAGIDAPQSGAASSVTDPETRALDNIPEFAARRARRPRGRHRSRARRKRGQ